MCTGKCSICIAFTLYPLIVISISCNIMLFFPDWNIKYARRGHITEQVKYMGGVVGGGLMVFMSALFSNLAGERGCWGNRSGMFCSIVFAAVGAAGAVYSFIVALLAIGNGPLCKVGGTWTTPFKSSNINYLADSESWGKCTEPKNVVLFNTGLFLILMVTACLQALLCAVQIINGLIGCLCGTCRRKE